MAQITFKAKIQSVYNPDESLAYEIVQVPQFTRRHCDMEWFRKSKAFGGFANSDLFPNILARIWRHLGLKDYAPHWRLDRLPNGVEIDRSGFLAKVSITIADERPKANAS